MPQQQQTDWFAQNAPPRAAPARRTNDDWFAANAPPTVRPEGIVRGTQAPTENHNPLIKGFVSPEQVEMLFGGSGTQDQELKAQLNSAIAQGKISPTKAGIVEFILGTGRDIKSIPSFLTSLAGVGAMIPGPTQVASGAVLGYEGAKALGGGIGTMIDEPGRIMQPDTMQEVTGGVAGMVGGGALGKAGAPRTAQLAGKAAQVVKDLPQIGRKPQVAASLLKEATNLPPKAIMGAENVFRAAAPTGTQGGFRANTYAAAGDLAEIAQTLDLKKSAGGIRNPDMRLTATEQALDGHLKKMVAEERVPQVQRNAQRPMSMNAGPDAVEGLRYLGRTAGKAEMRALAEKALNSKSLSLAEFDELARLANQELIPFERMSATDRATAGMTNRRLGSLKQLDVWLKESLNKELRQQGEIGLTEYERRYAALSELKHQFGVRKNSVELARSNVAGRSIRAVMGGKAGVASASQAAVADVNVGRMLQKGFDLLRESGLRPNRGTPGTPITGAIGPNRLALPPGQISVGGQPAPLQLPANAASLQQRIPVGPVPDTSFVRGVPAAPGEGGLPVGTRSLPPATSVAPEGLPLGEPGGPSRMSVTPSEAVGVRDAKTGQFTKGYSGLPKRGSFVGEVWKTKQGKFTWDGEMWVRQ